MANLIIPLYDLAEFHEINLILNSFGLTVDDLILFYLNSYRQRYFCSPEDLANVISSYISDAYFSTMDYIAEDDSMPEDERYREIAILEEKAENFGENNYLIKIAEMLIDNYMHVDLSEVDLYMSYMDNIQRIGHNLGLIDFSDTEIDTVKKGLGISDNLNSGFGL